MGMNPYTFKTKNSSNVPSKILLDYLPWALQVMAANILPKEAIQLPPFFKYFYLLSV